MGYNKREKKIIAFISAFNMFLLGSCSYSALLHFRPENSEPYKLGYAACVPAQGEGR